MTWQHVTIDEATEQIKTGGTPSTARSEFFGGSVPWFTPSDVGVSRLLNMSSRSLTQAAIDKGQAPLFEPEMLLVTCIGDIGRVGVLQRASSANQQITALKFCDDIDVNPNSEKGLTEKRKRAEIVCEQNPNPRTNCTERGELKAG